MAVYQCTSYILESFTDCLEFPWSSGEDCGLVRLVHWVGLVHEGVRSPYRFLPGELLLHLLYIALEDLRGGCAHWLVGPVG